MVGTHETTTFRDHESSEHTVHGHNFDNSFNYGSTENSELGNFLSRPIRIATYTWSVGTSLSQILNPWTAYFNDSHVAGRVNNFYLVRGNMHVKLLVNGNPFYYGLGIASYQPLHTVDDIYNSGGDDPTGTSTLMTLSQMQTVYLQPTVSEGGELTLPYMFPANWVNVSDTDWTKLGQLHIRSFTDLAHANGGTDPITISVFAWLEDVSLSVPTTLTYQSEGVLEYQADDEHGKGIVEKASSAALGVASKLSTIPIIGQYAAATMAPLSMLKSVSRLFGFSRPAVLDYPKLYKPRYYGNLAATDMDENVDKLALDSKQETSVDPRLMGLDGQDEMSFQSILPRESYLTQFGWTTTQNVDQFLFNVRVNPALMRFTTLASGAELVAHTPMSHISQLFRYWTGTINVRLKVICSAYHRGRLRITWDPAYYSGSGGDNWNTVFTKILDISSETDVCIPIPWGQPEAYAHVLGINAKVAPYGPLRYTTTQIYDNGVLSVEVLNELTTPNNVSDTVSVLVYVSGGDDLEFFNPVDRLQEVSFADDLTPPVLLGGGEETKSGLEFQSDSMEETKDDTIVAKQLPATSAMIYGGERIVSIRQLLKRYCFTRGFGSDGTTAGNYQMHTYRFNDFPAYRGFDLTGGMDITSAGGIYKYNYVKMTPLNYLTPAFVCNRGALRYKYANVSGTGSMPIRVTRDPETISAYIALNTVSTTTTDSALSDLSTAIESGWEGMSVNPVEMNPVVEVDLPFYSALRFRYARKITRLSDVGDDSQYFNHTVSLTKPSGTTHTYLHQYVATGEDFNLGYYLHAPCMYLFASPDPQAPV